MPTAQTRPESSVAAPSIASGSLEPAIREHRTAEATITLLGPDGAPAAGVEVTVAQRRHAFLFGSIGFGYSAPGFGYSRAPDLIRYVNGELDGDEDRAERERVERFVARWLDLLNFGTMPFYWGRFERERGKPDTARVLAASRWLVERGVRVKGHPLLWHTACADWLLPLSNDEIVEAQRGRIRREVSDFRGVIDTWDVVNEAVIMPVYDRYDNGPTRICRANGRIATVRMAFEAARQSNPNACLILNDFDMSTAYECLIEGLLAAGVQIDVLGLQSHMHQGYWGADETRSVIDRFARYGLPLHFTEITLLSGDLMPPEIDDLNDYQPAEWPSTPEGEERQAQEAVEFYKTLLSHPAVKAATWWDLADGCWLGAPGGLITADCMPKPAYEALHGLIKGEWWLAPTTVRTDEAGRVGVSGFLGEYEVAAGGGAAGGGAAGGGAVAAGGAGVGGAQAAPAARFSLDRPGPIELEVRL
jgi:endo-1,4-beta-xylanase